MLRDADLDSLNNHLGALSRENQKHNENLQNLLEQFKSLLEDYSSLKSDYEEVKEGREKYKKQARGQVWLLCASLGHGRPNRRRFLGPQPLCTGTR